MPKKKVVLLVSHCPDPLINKRLLMLKKDYSVTIIYVNRGNDNFIYLDGVEYIKLNKSFKNGKLFRRVFTLFNIKSEVKRHLRNISPDYIYAFRLDMLLIILALGYGKKKLIYEVADLHNIVVNNSRNVLKIIMKKFVMFIEKIAMKSVDLLSITSQKYYDVYFKNMILYDKVVYMPNIPNLECFKTYEKKNIGAFTIGFIGVVRYKEQMKMLIEAAKITNIHVLFAGIANDDEIENMAKNYDFIEYYGPYNYNSDIAKLYSKCDCIYSVYDIRFNNVKYALPNKLYESIYCELPILVSSGTYLSQIAEELGVGVSVQSNSLDDLVNKISLLYNDTDFYQQLVNRCKKNKSMFQLDKYDNIFIKKLNSL